MVYSELSEFFSGHPKYFQCLLGRVSPPAAEKAENFESERGYNNEVENDEHGRRFSSNGRACFDDNKLVDAGAGCNKPPIAE
jgi:hypothetical protein